MPDVRDFFVSFNQADRAWAAWIAWTLEDAGYTVLFQDWDFKGNFVLEMDKAHTLSRRTIAVLSPDYLTSRFTKPEWAARFKEDSTSEHDLLIPVRVRPCEVKGLLAQIVYVDLIGATREQARERLIDRVQRIRLKPKEEPIYPGDPLPPDARSVPTEPRFPPTEPEPTLARHNLAPANPDFVGREQVLADLRKLLSSGQGPAVLTQAITGLGGIGKTQTALAYCYRHLADYRLIWWLRAETPEGLADDFTTLAGPLGLDPASAGRQDLLAKLRAALQERGGWLLVFDNVEDPQLPRTYLPPTGRGHVLITSRRSDWYQLAKTLPLEIMPEGEAVQLLTGQPRPKAALKAEAKALARDLGYLPLALAQARAYTAETGRSLAAYRKLFEASRPAMLEQDRPSPGYPTSIAKTWQISIDAAAAKCPAARPLLELLAFFAPDALPAAVLAADTEALPDGLRGEVERDNALRALNLLSLIRAEADTITVHRLVQAVTRDGLGEATARARAEAAVRLVNAAVPRPATEHTNWPAIGTLLPHALAASEAAERLGAGLEVAGTVLNATRGYFWARAASAEAEPVLKRGLAILERALGPEHPNVANALNDLAAVYWQTGRYVEAEPPLKRALAITEKALGREHPDLASLLNSLAALYRDTRRLAEAEPLSERALLITERALGPEHPTLAIRLNVLGLLYRDTGRDAEAGPLFRRALAITEKALGPQHPNVAIRLNNLANLYRDAGRCAEAEPLYRRALSIIEKTLPPTHPHLAACQRNYALLLDQLGRADEAAALRAGADAVRR